MARRKDLAGTTAVITGAGSGIGRALAVRLSRAGCPVALADYDAEGLTDTAGLVAGPVLTREVDVSDRQAMMALAAEVDEWTPAPIGAVINNAGVDVSQPFTGAAVEDDEWVMNVNFGGVLNGSHAFMPILIRQGSGSLVNVSSVFGLFGYPNHSAYSASKHAVRGFTESLRHEMRGSGIDIAVVHPGGIQTNIVANSRFHTDDFGSENRDEAAQRFASIARTTPEKAARIIQSGIERRDPRIRIGADAVLIDLIVRAAPVRHFGIFDRVIKRM